MTFDWGIPYLDHDKLEIQKIENLKIVCQKEYTKYTKVYKKVMNLQSSIFINVSKLKKQKVKIDIYNKK